MSVLSLIAQQDGDLGGGKIDNFIVQSSVHRLNGVLVLATLLAAAVWLTWLAVKRRPFDGRARVLAVLVDVGLVSAGMAYVIGQAYVNG